MAVRLYSEFKSDTGVLYRIEIHDSQWLASATEFNVDSRGFELRYEGETDDIVSPIVGSRLTFGAYAANATFDTFIETLKGFQENRFRVVIYKPNPSRVWESWTQLWENATEPWDELSLYWAGWVIQDLVSVEDTSEPYIYEISAADGLGRLANIDYTSANAIAPGLTAVPNILVNCLRFTETYDLWENGGQYLKTSVDWWETTLQTYSTTKDTLGEHAIDMRVFQYEDDDANTIYAKAYEVLVELCTTYGARIYQSDGKWVFEQYVNRSDVNRVVTTYDYNATRLFTETIDDDVKIDQTSNAARLGGGEFTFLPAVGSVIIEYARQKFDSQSPPYTFRSTSPTKTLGIIGASTATQLKFYGPHNYNITSSTGVTSNDDIIAVVWRMQIRIESATTPGLFYYYNRPFNGFNAASVYGNAEWSTTAGYYYYNSPFSRVLFGSITINSAPVIITANLPTSGTLRITSEHYGNFLPSTGAAYNLAIHQTDTWQTTLTIIRMDNANDDVSVIYRATNLNPNANSKIELSMGTTRIANGLFQTGDLSVYDGSSWVSSVAFRRGNTGTGDQVLNLLTKEMVGLHSAPIRRFSGDVFNNEPFGHRYAFDDAYWVKTGGSFTANNDQWSAEWFAIQYISANIGDIDDIRQPMEAIGSGGSNVTNSDGIIEFGRVGGMSVDASQERIGPFEQTATGGGVVGTLAVSSTSTFNGSVLMESTGNVNGAWVANIVDVTASSGNTYEVSSTDYILFATWSGENGTFYIALPPVESSDGRMIRIKTDSTISNSKLLSIIPAAGDTGVLIDGESSSSMTRSYDGATYLCHNGDWWVIQKKDKG